MTALVLLRHSRCFGNGFFNEMSDEEFENWRTQFAALPPHMPANLA